MELNSWFKCSLHSFLCPANPRFKGQGWWEAIKKMSSQGGRDEPRWRPWITVCQLLERGGMCLRVRFELYKSKLTICAANMGTGKHHSESVAARPRWSSTSHAAIGYLGLKCAKPRECEQSIKAGLAGSQKS